MELKVECRIPECTLPLWANKLCHYHDNNMRKYGSVYPPRKPSTLERFQAGFEIKETCWVWTKGLSSNGYGKFWYDGNTMPAHIWSYEYVFGKNLEETLDHLCRNRACVNPFHLEPCSRWENVRRGNTVTGDNSRKTHCKWGHPFEGANLAYTKPPRARRCRACSRAWATGRHPTDVAVRL